jgi:hypothetical protein
MSNSMAALSRIGRAIEKGTGVAGALFLFAF